jgi:hypothetical protein
MAVWKWREKASGFTNFQYSVADEFEFFESLVASAPYRSQVLHLRDSGFRVSAYRKRRDAHS